MGRPEQIPGRSPQQDSRLSFLFPKNLPESSVSSIVDRMKSWMPHHETDIDQELVRYLNKLLQKKTSRRAFLIGAGTLIPPTVFVKIYPEATELGINLFATYLRTPDAPFANQKETKPKIKKVMTLYDDMMTRFGTHNDLLLEKPMTRNILDTQYAMVWPYTRAIEATYAMRFLPGVGQEADNRYKGMLQALEGYWNNEPTNHKPGYDPGLKAFKELNPKDRDDRYVDDNLWVAQILMHEYKKTKNPRLLTRIKEIYALVTSQWDTTRNGGVFWKQQFDDESAHGRGVVSNAPAITLGVDLYQATGDDRYLKFAEKTYNWINKELRDEKDGLYFDNIDYTGVLGKQKWSYCQGAMIGAMVKLHEASPEKYPLSDAVAFAVKALRHFEKVGYEGHSKLEEDNAFNAIFFQNLLYLADKVQNADFTRRIQETLSLRVDRLSGRYKTLLGHAGALHLAALNGMDPKDYSHLY